MPSLNIQRQRVGSTHPPSELSVRRDSSNHRDKAGGIVKPMKGPISCCRGLSVC